MDQERANQQPADAADRAAFRLPLPSGYNFAFDTIERWAADPLHLAMLWLSADGSEERRITFADFAARSSQFANALVSLGIAPGERVIVMLGQVPTWWEALLGLMKMGAVTVPCPTQLLAMDLIELVNATQAVAIVTDAAGAARIDEVRANLPSLRRAILIDAERPQWTAYEPLIAAHSIHYARHHMQSSDPCLIDCTAGTTGRPKLVAHDHTYPLAQRVVGQDWLALGSTDLVYAVCEFGWAEASWSYRFGPWLMGAALFVQDIRGEVDPRVVGEHLARSGITVLHAPPQLYRRLLQTKLAQTHWGALRQCVSAGDTLDPAVMAAWQAVTGLDIREGYGLTETGLLCFNYPSQTVRPGSIGQPAPGVTLAVVDAAGRSLPPGKEGDLAVKVAPTPGTGLGPGQLASGMFQGYFQQVAPDHQADLASIPGHPADHPDAAHVLTRQGDWYLTGDRAYVDVDGYFWLMGRAADIILSAGYRISPHEVEAALTALPAVREAAVVASPDAIRGAIVKAYIVYWPLVLDTGAGLATDSLRTASGFAADHPPTGDADLANAIQQHLQRHLAPYMYPRELEFVQALPKTSSGKIRRVELRAREIAHYRARSSTPLGE